MKCLLLLILVWFSLTNMGTEARIARLLWVSHPYNRIGPVSQACGEIKPGETFNLSHGQKPGVWEIEWSDLAGRGKTHSIALRVDAWVEHLESIDTGDTQIIVTQKRGAT